MTDEQTQEYIGALLRERQYADEQGKTDKVAEVDAELARVGHEAEPPAKRATTRGPDSTTGSAATRSPNQA